MNTVSAKIMLMNGDLDEKLAYLYACPIEEAALHRERLINAIEKFEELFGVSREISIFSAPGRTEIGGNHTDHQLGRVLAASVNLDVVAVVSENDSNLIRVKSEGYPQDTVDISSLEVVEQEKNTSAALIRGMCSRFRQLGYSTGGFDAYTTSNVLQGSGLSSSASFEVLLGTAMNALFCGGKETSLSIAQISQYTENVYFGKPSGLMDQSASSIGGFITIDFENREAPRVERIDFDFAHCGYTLCIIDTHGSHANLTPDYAAIPEEMKSVAACFGKEVLRQVPEVEFYDRLPQLRKLVGDRAVLRAIHFYGDNQRVLRQVEALRAGDFDLFKTLVIESGASSYQYLQNVFSTSYPGEQGVSVTLALCERLLKSRGGAWRVHGAALLVRSRPLSLWITWKPSAKKWTLSWERVPATCFLSVLLEVPRSYKGRKKQSFSLIEEQKPKRSSIPKTGPLYFEPQLPF